MAGVASSPMFLQFSFLCGLRGYHEYKLFWAPTLHEILPARPEVGNRFDRFAVAGYRRFGAIERVVGHLPREISCFMYFIIVHGATVTCKVTDVHHRRSPLIQGGLEIPIEVTVSMETNDQNKQALELCRKSVQMKYAEPVNGEYEDFTDRILQALHNAYDLLDESEDDESEEDDDDYAEDPTTGNT